MQQKLKLNPIKRVAGFGRLPRKNKELLHVRACGASLGLVSTLLMPPMTLLTIRASWLARLHTILSLTAFIGALVIASSLHYTKIVRNAIAGWPEEWFPSVSAT